MKTFLDDELMRLIKDRELWLMKNYIEELLKATTHFPPERVIGIISDQEYRKPLTTHRKPLTTHGPKLKDFDLGEMLDLLDR